MQPAEGGERRDGLRSPRNPATSGKLFLFSPGYTCGCQAVEDLKVGNGYLMTGCVQIKYEHALFVPSGSALKLAVNGARRLV